MFSFKQWVEFRKTQKSKIKYADGFGWAMAAYYIELKPIEEIEACIYGRSDSFDSGAGGAIFELHRIEKDKKQLTEIKKRLQQCEFVLTGELDMLETDE